MVTRLFLSGEREESPGEFPNGTTNGPTECASTSPCSRQPNSRQQTPDTYRWAKGGLWMSIKGVMWSFLLICRVVIVQASFLRLTRSCPPAMLADVERLDWVNDIHSLYLPTVCNRQPLFQAVSYFHV